MSMHFLSKIKRFILSAFVSYFKDNQHFGFRWKKGQWSLQPIAQPKVIQVNSRPHYQEQVEKLPVTDKKALSALLKLRNQQNTSPLSAVQIRYQDANSTALNQWQFDAGSNRSAWIVLPESLILAESCQEGEVLEVQEKFYVAKGCNIVFSGFKFGLINSKARFADSVGVTKQSDKDIDTEDALVRVFESYLLRTLTLSKRAFFQSQGGAQLLKIVKAPALLCVCLFGVYLALSSGYLMWQEQTLSAKLNENRTEINQALSSFSRFEQNVAHIEAWHDIFSAQPKMASLIPILDKLKGLAKIESIRFEGERFVIRGKSDSAITVLEALSTHAWVVSPQFDSPVRRSQGQEEFVMSYDILPTQFKSELQMSSEANAQPKESL